MQDTENKPPSLSVVVPVRNEEKTLPELHERLRAALPADAEIVFVDDGSADRSATELARIVSVDRRVVALRLARRFGKSHALAVGFERSTGSVIATFDADLQEQPEDIVRLRNSLREGEGSDGLDLVTGWRRNRRDPFAKVLVSRIFNALVRLLAGVALRDINCGLKVMRREVLESLQLEGGFHRFVPLLAHWRGFEVGEVEVEHAPRRHGRSRYGSERIVHAMVDLMVLLFLERFERRPSRIFLTLGSLLFAAGFSICVYITYLKITTTTIQSRYPLLTLGVLFLVVGLQVVCTGFLAELVAQHRRGTVDRRVRVLEIEPSADQETADSGQRPAQKGAVSSTLHTGETALSSTDPHERSQS